MVMKVNANRIKSGYSKGALIFFLVMFVLCASFIVALILIDVGVALRIIGFLFCGVFLVISLVMILDTFFDYVIVEGETMSKRFFFQKKEIPLESITKVVKTEGYYDIYVGKKKFTSLNDIDPQTPKMLFQIEKAIGSRGNPVDETQQKGDD